MSLAKKFLLLVFSSILFIAIINIIGFYIFYSSYLKVFLAEKIKNKSEITLDYINKIVLKSNLEKQSKEIDNLFNDASINFFEKLGDNNKIKLDKKENIDVVVNYLIKSGVAPKYIEEIIPTNNFEKVVGAFKNKNSPEYRFLRNLLISQIILNILAITIIGFFVFIFIQKTLIPVKKATKQIINLKPGKRAKKIIYKGNDEIGFLVSAINLLNKKILIQESIRNKLLADISHELKTPITSIQCYLEGIIDGVIKLDEKNLNSITSEMKRLISLVNKIMEFEKYENKSLKLNKKEKYLYEIIKIVVETHKKRLKENNQKIKITGYLDLQKEIDENSFIQLLHNLIGNFLKYAGENTSMNIILNKKFIEFSDNGKGIKKSEIPYLTEKFYQGDSSKSKDIEQRGIGIGLSIVGKIILEHNWSFVIKSDINKGFSFKIYF